MVLEKNRFENCHMKILPVELKQILASPINFEVNLTAKFDFLFERQITHFSMDSHNRAMTELFCELKSIPSPGEYPQNSSSKWFL